LKEQPFPFRLIPWGASFLETEYEKSEAVRTTEHFMEQVMQGRKRRAESADFLSAALNLSTHFYV
jgi:hypothetical protein